jgi:glycine oxidase
VASPRCQLKRKRFAQLLARTQNQLPSLPALQSLGNSELADKEPALHGRFQNALYLPDEGQLDNRQLLDILTRQPSYSKRSASLEYI